MPRFGTAWRAIQAVVRGSRESPPESPDWSLMGDERRVKQAVTVRGPLVSELLGEPGPELTVRERRQRDPAKPTHCPVCGRRVIADRLEEHLDCYDPDAACTTSEVAAWLGVARR